MLLHPLELSGGQLPRLVENVLGHRELARVVQQCRRFDRLHRQRLAHAERAREADGVRLHAAHVAVRHVVFRVDRHRERFDRRQLQAIHVAEVALRVLQSAERRAQRQVKDSEQGYDHRGGHEAALLEEQD